MATGKLEGCFSRVERVLRLKVQIALPRALVVMVLMVLTVMGTAVPTASVPVVVDFALVVAHVLIKAACQRRVRTLVES